MFSWRDLDYWESGEWQWTEEQLNDLRQKKVEVNPNREHIFRALDICPFETVRCAIVGQDPFPDPRFSTGVAFSIPANITYAQGIPPSLANIISEYEKDLHYPKPSNGNFEAWSKAGVLLWNAYPTCLSGSAGSHRWPEWEFLTKEIVERVSAKGAVCVFLGSAAQAFAKYVHEAGEVLNIGHPSPLANMKKKDGTFRAKTPFLGSRVFTRINDAICQNKLGEAINWRLD